jgi:hypothetical protein
MSKTPSPSHALRRLTPPLEPDDRSTHAHRQLIGYCGLLLPLLLWLVAGWRPVPNTRQWSTLESISCYYYSGAVAVYIGTISALAFFLFTYRGFSNSQWPDILLSYIAAFAAVCVVLFPYCPGNGFLEPVWWKEWMGSAHNYSTAILLACFAFFSLFRFTLGDKSDKESRLRKRIYIACGSAMTLSLIWALIWLIQDRPVFWHETSALFFFGISWLTKGRALYSARAAAFNVWHYPLRSLKALFGLK